MGWAQAGLFTSCNRCVPVESIRPDMQRDSLAYPYTKIEAVGAGAGRAEIWHTFHTLLSMRKGDCEDHAVLLCSLLLGFRP